MTSNQATSSANMAGNLFQIFNLPKAGNSSYLFSDIIKVIGGDSETDTGNGLLNLLLVDSSKTLIDSNKLINLLNANINCTGASSEETGEGFTGKYFITENDLADFINKLGLEETAGIAKQSSEIAIEVTPDFLNKLSALINNSKNSVHKNIFATIAPDEDEITKLLNSDGEEVEEAEGTGKIQVIFKKVTEESDIIAAPQPFIFNTEQNYALNGKKIASEEELLLSSKSNNIVLGGSKFDFFAGNSGSAGTAGVEISGSDGTKQTVNIAAPEESSIFQAVFNEETDAAAEVKTPVSNILSAAEETNVEAPVIKIPADTKIKISGTPSVDTEIGKQNIVNKETALPVESEPSGLPVEDTIEINTLAGVKTSNTKNEADSIVKPEVKATTPGKESKSKVVKSEPGILNTEASDNEAESKIEIKNNFKAEIVTGKTTDSTTDKTVYIKATDPKLQESEKEILSSGTTIEKDIKETAKSKTYSRQVKVDTEPVKENKQTEFAGRNTAGEEAVEQEPENTFRFSSRFSNEFLRKQSNSFSQVNNKAASSSDNAKLYEVIFEKTLPESSIYAEKTLPQDFDTSDYETLSSGIFNSKMAESIKEYKNAEKPEFSEKNSLNVNKEVKESNSTEEQSTNTGNNNNGNSEANNKQNYKSGNETLFADQLQSKSTQVNQAAESRPVKNYTPLFKEVNAANLIDEVKNLCFKGEKTNITLKLSPEHLGNVKLSIDIKDSVMNTSIEVENESVRQVVQNNMDSLRQSLQQNGIQLNSFTVSLSNQQEQKSPGKPGAKKGKQGEETEINLSGDEKTLRTKKMGYNTYEYLA